MLIPLQAHFFGLQGLGKLLETVTLVRQRINSRLEVGGVVLCMHEPTTRLAMEVVEDLRKFIESGRGTSNVWARAKIYDTCIRRNIKLAESCSFGQTVFDYAPKSNGALDYAQLAAEIIGPVTATAVPVNTQIVHLSRIDMQLVSAAPQESTLQPAEAASIPMEPRLRIAAGL